MPPMTTSTITTALRAVPLVELLMSRSLVGDLRAGQNVFHGSCLAFAGPGAFVLPVVIHALHRAEHRHGADRRDQEGCTGQNERMGCGKCEVGDREVTAQSYGRLHHHFRIAFHVFTPLRWRTSQEADASSRAPIGRIFRLTEQARRWLRCEDARVSQWASRPRCRPLQYRNARLPLRNS